MKKEPKRPDDARTSETESPDDGNGTERRGSLNVSRRGFLKGVGGTAVTAAVIPAIRPAAAQQEAMTKGATIGSVSLKVNGKQHALQKVEARTTLLHALRDQLDLTGAKPICERASCGGCTVLMDGKAVYSCSILAMDAEGRELTTVEGLAKGDELHPVQQAFVEHDALMCGFCTPGFIMSVTGLLNTNKNPTLDDVKRAVSGNICRCGTYTRVFEAALAAAETMRKGA